MTFYGVSPMARTLETLKYENALRRLLLGEQHEIANGTRAEPSAEAREASEFLSARATASVVERLELRREDFDGA